MPELTMPRLSDTMQEGTLVRWLKQQGEPVEQGEVLAEIETDKATMELESYSGGVLEKILVQEGQTVPIGQPIAVVGTGQAADGGQAGDDRQEAASEVEQTEAPATPVEKEPGAKPSAEPAAAAAAAPAERRPTPAPAAAPSDEVKASPMARAIARERGIDLQKIRGTGPGGRVIRADVEAASAGDGLASPQSAAPEADRPAPAEPPRVAAIPQPSAAEVEEVPLTNIRRVVARRMLESVQSAPHFYLTSVVDAQALVRFRAEVNERLAASGEQNKVSLNDLLVKACATALKTNPDVNVSFGGDKLLRHRRVNVGIAVALEGGLIVPVVRDADQKSLGQISREAQLLIQKARAGKLTPDDYSGGTFTISNLGMFGIDHFTAIINSPEAAILAVGATTAEPVVRAGQVTVRETIKLTLSIDHRALDGATASRFLQYLKAILEEPLRIVV